MAYHPVQTAFYADAKIKSKMFLLRKGGCTQLNSMVVAELNRDSFVLLIGYQAVTQTETGLNRYWWDGRVC